MVGVGRRCRRRFAPASRMADFTHYCLTVSCETRYRWFRKHLNVAARNIDAVARKVLEGEEGERGILQARHTLRRIKRRLRNRRDKFLVVSHTTREKEAKDSDRALVNHHGHLRIAPRSGSGQQTRTSPLVESARKSAAGTGICLRASCNRSSLANTTLRGYVYVQSFTVLFRFCVALPETDGGGANATNRFPTPSRAVIEEREKSRDSRQHECRPDVRYARSNASATVKSTEQPIAANASTIETGRAETATSYHREPRDRLASLVRETARARTSLPEDARSESADGARERGSRLMRGYHGDRD